MTIPPDLINHVVAAIYNHQGALRRCAERVQHIAPDMAQEMLTVANRLLQLTLEPFTSDTVQSEPSWHNPDNLTKKQIGTADGWRLLTTDEIIQGSPFLKNIECWDIGQWQLNQRGSADWCTYRTKLSRADLAAARSAVKDQNP